MVNYTPQLKDIPVPQVVEEFFGLIEGFARVIKFCLSKSLSLCVWLLLTKQQNLCFVSDSRNERNNHIAILRTATTIKARCTLCWRSGCCCRCSRRWRCSRRMARRRNVYNWIRIGGVCLLNDDIECEHFGLFRNTGNLYRHLTFVCILCIICYVIIFLIDAGLNASNSSRYIRKLAWRE